MTDRTILFSTIDGLKRRAKTLKKQSGMKHTQALDATAKAGGYESFKHARKVLGND